MTVPEVARALRCSKMTVLRLIHRGALQASRVGRQIRVEREVVRRFMDDGGTK
jgi:excisionase family DNA binding protein